MARRLFSDSQLERIYLGAVRVLGEMGMRVHNRQAMEALERFGARVDYPAQCATFAPDVIERMLAIVRADNPGWQRARPQVHKDWQRAGGGSCPFFFDDETWAKRRADEADCILALKVVDTAGIAVTEPPVYNSDCPPRFESIRCLQLAIETLARTTVCSMDLFFGEQVPFAVELGRLYKNDPRWFLPGGNCPTTPLTIGKTVADVAVAAAPYAPRYGVPPMPIMGVNAPMTPAGAAVIGVAEILGGWTLAKALNPLTPVGAVALSAIMDMKRGEVVYVAPEPFIADIGMIETFELLLHLPCGAAGRYIDAPAPGLQALYEQSMRSVMFGLYSNIMAFEGTLDKGRVFSPTQLMLDCDVNGLLVSATDEPTVSDETLAIDTILEMGFHPDYLTHEHTIRHMREAWKPSLLESLPAAAGGDRGTERELLHRAREQWRENLKKYQPPNHSDDFLRDLRAICTRARKTLEA